MMLLCMNNTINSLFSCRTVAFDLDFPNNRLDSFDEGVELGFRDLNSGREWIPLTFYASRVTSIRDDKIKVGDIILMNDTINIRGYNVPFILMGSAQSVQLKVCGKEIERASATISFRWLQTVLSPGVEGNEAVVLDNVAIYISFPQLQVLLIDNFNNQDTIIE